MARVWAILIEKGIRTFSGVPKKWQEACKKNLEEDGYTLNEDGTASKEE